MKNKLIVLKHERYSQGIKRVQVMRQIATELSHVGSRIALSLIDRRIRVDNTEYLILFLYGHPERQVFDCIKLVGRVFESYAIWGDSETVPSEVISRLERLVEKNQEEVWD